MQWLSLLYPVAYLGIMIGSLATFSHLYRQRQLNSKLSLAPYFGPHTARNIYLSLLHLPDRDPSNNTKIPESILRAALLARAVEDISRIMEIRLRKPALAQLLQRGTVGDEMFQRLQRAEQELDIEVRDVVNEANALAPGWGQTIFQSASEMTHNKTLREKLVEIKGTIPKEKKIWDDTRENARRELLGEDKPASTISTASGTTFTDNTSTTNTSRPSTAASTDLSTTTPLGEKTPGKAGSSDEDGVIVETPGITSGGIVTGGNSGGGGGKNKKKKNKK